MCFLINKSYSIIAAAVNHILLDLGCGRDSGLAQYSAPTAPAPSSPHMLAVIPRQAGQKVSLRSGEKMSTSATLMHDNRSHSSVHGLSDASCFAKKHSRHSHLGKPVTLRTKKKPSDMLKASFFDAMDFSINDSAQCRSPELFPTWVCAC